MGKTITILHSNDMHGDFQAEETTENGMKEGGLSLLSGYINRVRQQERNILYFIAGDMVQGSLIDSEFQSLSTVQLMNYLSPDVVTIGNHEFDYGLAHFLFVEKLANFPIINANIYIEKYNKRLMKSHIVIKKDGIKILVIGVVTDEVLDRVKNDERIAPFISVRDAYEEIGKVCNVYRTDDIDLAIVLSHIGFEADIKLAEMLNPEWGIDLIIGGHSHTFLDVPEKVNDILIAHAGKGTDQIGRFEIKVDEETNRVVDYTWELVPITNEVAEPDLELQKFLDGFQQKIDMKNSALICRLVGPIRHDKREAETALGNLFADIFQSRAQANLALVGSASIRRRSLGPTVLLGDIKTIYPYDDKLIRVSLTGEQLFSLVNYFLRKENRHPDGEFYQVSRTIKATFDFRENQLIQLFVNAEPVDRNKSYSVCFEEFHYKNMCKKLNFPKDEYTKLKPKIISSSCRDVLIEYFGTNQNLTSNIEGRLIDVF